MKNAFSVLAFIAFLIGCTISSEDQSDLKGNPLLTDRQSKLLTEIDRNYDNFFKDKADSLSLLLWDEAIADSNYHLMVKININQIRYYVMIRDYAKGLEIVLETLELAEKSEHPEDKIMTTRWHSEAKLGLGQTEEALELINYALSIYETLEEPKDIKYVILGTRGKILKQMGRNYEALQDYYEFLRVIEGSDDYLRNKAFSNNIIGLILNEQDEHEEALERFTIAYNINRELNSVRNLSTNLNNIAMALNGLGRDDEAIDTLFSTIEFNTEFGLKHSIVQNKYNLAVSFIRKEDYQNAIDIAKKGLEMSQELNFSFGILYHNAVLGRAYFESGNYNAALDHAAESFKLSDRFGVTKIKSDASELLYKIHANRDEKDKAIAFLEAYHELQLEINEYVRNTQISELSAQYNMELKEAEFLLLQQNLAIQETLNVNQRQINVFLILAMIIIGGFLIYTFKNQRRLRHLLSELRNKKNDIQEKNTALEKLNNDRNALIGVIVHDLKNPLSSISGLVEVMSMNELDEENKSLLSMVDISSKKMQRLVNNLLDIKKVEYSDIQNELRDVSIRDIVEDSMSTFRMMAARKLIIIREEIEEFKVKTYPDYVSRIIDNLVSNAIKFSNLGAKVSLTIKKADDAYWEIIVDDEGVGIPEKEKKKLFKMFSQISNRPTGGESSTGIGLYTVALLAGKLNGTVFLEDKVKAGTRFVCKLPLNTAEEDAHATAQVISLPT